MVYTKPSTQVTGFKILDDQWNELVNNWRTLFTTLGLLTHEFGGVEADISTIADGGIVRGTGAGTMAVLASFLTSGGLVKHEKGGIEADISAITKGGLISASAAGAAALLVISGTDGDVLQVDAAESTGMKWTAIPVAPTFLGKTADETVNNSSTFQDDDDLTFSVVANKNYAVNGFLVMEPASNVPDIKFKMSVPALCLWESRLFDAGSGSIVAWTEDADRSMGLDTGGIETSFFHGVIKNGANAGTAVVQWAQQTANASDTKLLAGTWMSFKLLN